jgi:hypothetical protein
MAHQAFISLSTSLGSAKQIVVSQLPRRNHNIWFRNFNRQGSILVAAVFREVLLFLIVVETQVLAPGLWREDAVGVGDAVDLGCAELIAGAQRRPRDLHLAAVTKVGRQARSAAIALPTTRYIAADIQRFFRRRPAARPMRPNAAKAHVDGSGSDAMRTDDRAGAQF